MVYGHLRNGRAARLARLALGFLTIIFTYPHASTDSACAARATVAWDPDTVSKNYSWPAAAATQRTYTVPGLSEGAAYATTGQILTVTQAGTAAYTLSVSTSGAGSGTVTGSPTGTTFRAGMTVTLTAVPDAGSTFGGWSGGVCSGTASTCKVTINSNVSVTATFALQSYTITAAAGAGGSIFPSGLVSVNVGGNQTFIITPKSGYTIQSVVVNGSSVGQQNSYTFSYIVASHTIQATFEQTSKDPPGLATNMR